MSPLYRPPTFSQKAHIALCGAFVYPKTMLKLYSQLIGLPFYLLDEEQKGGIITQLILDPERGNLVALITVGGQWIAALDVAPFNGEYWEISSGDALLEEGELVRVMEISEKKRWLIHKPVVTKDGEYLGRIDDFVMEMETLTLAQLYVTKKFLFLTSEKRIIHRSEILEITEKSVVVKNDRIEAPETLKDYFKLKEKVGALEPSQIRCPFRLKMIQKTPFRQSEMRS